MRHAVAMLIFVSVCVAAPVPKTNKKRPDAEVFSGVWEVTTDGRSDKFTWTFDEDLTMWSKAVGANGPGSKWVMKIDPDKSPKQIDFASGNGINLYQGIYEIDGDEIRIAYASSRPTDFDQKKRDSYTVLRRVQK